MIEDAQFWFTLAVIGAMTAALVLELADTALVVFAALLALLLSGVISTDEAFSGFNNQGMLAVGFLYVVAYATYSTGVLNVAAKALLGNGAQPTGRRLLRFLTPVAGMSAFMNNTPIVSMLIPLVKNRCRRLNLSPSKFMLPLSYAAILGGTCTLIGTSTNLVTHGFLLERGHAGFGFFDFAWVGVPLTLIGLAMISLLTHRLLPDRKDTLVEMDEDTREFVIELKVLPDYPHIGETIEQAGLRHLQGLYLFQIERNGYTIAPVPPDEQLRRDDRLFFTGLPSTIVELQKEKGLQLLDEAHFDLKNYDSNRSKTYELVLSDSAPVVGKTVREADFRGTYNAVILAIHRNGQRIKDKIGNIRLQPGDTLLVLAGREFYKRWQHSRNFLLVSSSDEVPSRSPRQQYLTFTVLALMIAAVTTGLLQMVTAAALAAAVYLASRLVTLQQAIQAVDWRVLLVIAASFGLAAALENAGIAAAAGTALAAATEPLGLLGAIALIMLTTMIYSEMVTNNAAAVIIFPVMLSVAGASGYDLFPLAMAVAIGASAAFSTPISYQTNLMVYGPGRYRFTDYLKAGIPMDAVVWVCGSLLIWWAFG